MTGQRDEKSQTLQEAETRPFQLAQLSVARPRAPLDSPQMQGFVSELEAIYRVAERSRGFVWRLRSEDVSRAASVLSSINSDTIITLSVWESVEALSDYVYRSEHTAPLQRRSEWFEKVEGPNLVLWWIPVNSPPRVEQGLARLKYLAQHGPTAHAFTIKASFPPHAA